MQIATFTYSTLLPLPPPSLSLSLSDFFQYEGLGLIELEARGVGYNGLLATKSTETASSPVFLHPFDANSFLHCAEHVGCKWGKSSLLVIGNLAIITNFWRIHYAP